MKRKTNWKYLMMAAVLAIGTTSCKNDEVDGIEGQEDYDSYITLEFVKPQSYAYNPAGNAETPAEVAVQNAYVFFQNAGGLKAVAAEAAPTQSTIPGEENKWKATFKAKTGSQTLFVGLNLSDALKDAIELGGVYHVNDLVNLAGIRELSTGGSLGFAMFSQTEELVTVTATPAQNVFPVNVTRLVAKVYVEESSTLNKDNISNVTFQDLTFAMGQMNKKIYALQFRNSSNMIEDPNFSTTIQDHGTVNGVEVGENVAYYTDFISEFRPAGYKVDPIDYSVFLPVGIDGASTGNTNVKYVPENTSKDQYRGELTYACVKAEFIPLEFASYDNTLPDPNDWLTITLNPTPATHETTAYYVVRTKSSEYMYFKVEAEANDYYTDNTASCYAPEKYEDGVCYYHVLFNANNNQTGATNNYDVIRNEFYNLKVTKISQLGYSKPDIENPEIPEGKDTNITVEVTILPWTSVNEDINLGR